MVGLATVTSPSDPVDTKPHPWTESGPPPPTFTMALSQPLNTC